MQTRREFLKNAAMLSGAGGLWEGLEGSVRRAFAIEPAPGSSYFDAEHVVILMQENRSFDHAYGTLRGVRGYNDPRALTLANGNPVWVQTNAAGERYAPFRLDLKGSKATWMGSLPHSWTSQVDARNGGRHDRWLDAKRSGREGYATMPLTLGHYAREDIPFYYALADAFTICDQHFCSSLTPTVPNRLYHWTGTVRQRPSADAVANVRNEQIEQNPSFAGWTTFPERLEDHGISWRIYQNELSVETGLAGELDAWLSNYGDNALEHFAPFHVKAHPEHRAWVEQQEKSLPGRIAGLKAQLAKPDLSEAQSKKLKKRLDELLAVQRELAEERSHWDRDDLERLSAREQSLHGKAFTTNRGDPAYRSLADMKFKDGDAERRVQVPKGDVFHQFREDVTSGKLPTVSWLVAPERLSDHPESAWYGAWYVSEALRILTENPEVWRKTIFILTYDENDGYFDHLPPFVAPHPARPETGLTSKGIDASLDYVELEQDRKVNPKAARESPIGLGYRVPLVVASPWTRGGCVCSQVFDHTSVLQFLEHFLTRKTGKAVKEPNISSWRRAVCGDLTSLFQPAADEGKGPTFVARDAQVQEIYRAQFKPLPVGFKALSDADIQQIRRDPRSSPWMPKQEPGVRRSAALPYELYVDGSLNAERDRFVIRFKAASERFGERSAGSPFIVYARRAEGEMTVRNYAVAAGDQIEDSWALADFANGAYHLEVHGPNGFFREFVGSGEDPLLEVHLGYARANGLGGALNGNVEVRVANRGDRGDCDIEVGAGAYGASTQRRSVTAGTTVALSVNTQHAHQWYDVIVGVGGHPHFRQRFAGRVETGQWGFSDPAMGGVGI